MSKHACIAHHPPALVLCWLGQAVEALLVMALVCSSSSETATTVGSFDQQLNQD